ncbi:MAG: hypothetical protein WC685_07425 [Methylobacter sp.]
MKNQPSALQETCQPVFDQANEVSENLSLLLPLATTGRPVYNEAAYRTQPC